MIKILLSIFLFLGTPSARAEETMTVVRPCRIFLDASLGSAVVCKLRPKSEVEVLEGLSGEFVRVSTGSCDGFLPRQCLADQSKEKEKEKEPAKRTLSRKPDYFEFRKQRHFLFGLATHLDATLARVAYATTGSSGIGYGIGLEGRIRLTDRWHLCITSSYQQMKLSRTVDTGSTSISDPTPIEFRQTYTLATLQALGSFLAFGAATGNDSVLDWWFEGGGEFGYPVSATQTDSLGRTTSFSTTDKFLLLMVGPSAMFSLGQGFDLVTRLHGYYNVLSTSGSSLYGARVGVAVQLAL